MTFQSFALPRFWELYDQLPLDVQAQADKQYTLFLQNPKHPSLRFKPVGPFWSVRVSRSYRALAIRRGDVLIWLWIGTHADYDKIIS